MYERLLGALPEEEKMVYSDEVNFHKKIERKTKEYIRLIKKECYIPQGVEIRVKQINEDENSYMVVAEYPVEWLEQGHSELDNVFKIEETLPKKFGLIFKLKEKIINWLGI